MFLCSPFRDIKKGEEIFVNYGYGRTLKGETEWYFKQKEEVDRIVKEMNEKAETEMKEKAESEVKPEMEM